MKPALVVGLWVTTLAVLVGFGWFVWPGHYEYRTLPEEKTLARVDRVSGRTDLWNYREGRWMPFSTHR